MKNTNLGVVSMGIKMPIIREGDNIVDIITDKVLDAIEVETEEHIYSPHEWALLGIEGKKRCYDEDGDDYIPYMRTTYDIHDKDVLGITESVVARAAGQYITIDDIAADIDKKFGKDATIALINPIYSRNRFSLILKGIARAAKKVIIVMPEYDEVGNPRGVNPFTGVNIEEYYKELCKSESCECEITDKLFSIDCETPHINCKLHPSINESCAYHFASSPYTLKDICSDKSPDWGVLGTNKATEEKLKLFPSKVEAQRVCNGVKAKIKEKTGKDIIVMIYGDGSYKDFDAGIWEMADPVSSPGYTDKELLDSTPNEIKVKYFADKGYSVEEIKNEISNNKNNLKGNMASQGTTPRRYINLLASLMDLVSGSGQRCTPCVLIQNYF